VSDTVISYILKSICLTRAWLTAGG